MTDNPCQYGSALAAGAPEWFSYEIADVATALAITDLPGSALMSWITLELVGLNPGVIQTSEF